jgi:hypothetical protein
MSEYNIVKVMKNSTVEYSPADRNLENVKNIIYQRENPNPHLAFGLIACVVVVIYFIYVLFIKQNISGIWFGSLGEMPMVVKYKITHNPFTDTLTIKVAGKGTIQNGKLIGHTIYLYSNVGAEQVGVLIEHRKIVWVNSKDVWNHVKIL